MGLNFTIFILASISFVLNSTLNAVSNPVKEEQEILKNIKENFLKKDFSEAREIWQKNYSKYRYSSNFDYWGGKILLYLPERSENKRKQNLSRGIRYLKKVADGLKSSFVGNNKAKELYIDSLYHISIAFFLLNQVPRAIAFTKKVLEVDDRLLPAWLNLTIFYESLGKKAEADATYKKYLIVLEGEDDDF